MGTLAEERSASIRADYETRKAGLEKEFSARYGDRLKALEAEKARVNEALAEREKQLDISHTHAMELDAALAELRMSATDEKAAFSREYSAEMNRALKAAEEAARAREAELIADVNVLREELTEKDRVISLERERLVDELHKASSEAHDRSEERAAAVKAEYERRLADQASLAESATKELRELIQAKEVQLEKVVCSQEEAAKAREAELCADINVLREELTEKDRVLSLEREKLVDELSKASIEAHARTEERAAAVKAEYEKRLATLEAAAESRIAGIKALLAGKTAELEKAEQDRVLAEKGIKDEFERRVAELEAGISAKAAALEADYAVRREKLEADAAARAAAVNAESAVKMDFERRNWQAERARFENTLEETSGHFRAAQKEIENLNLGLRKAGETNAAREAAFNRDLMEAKATYDRELAYRVKDAVSVQTAHLVEALEAAKARQEELAAALENKENSIRALRGEAAEARRDYEEGLRAADSGALTARREELEKHYAGKTAALGEGMASLRRALEADAQALKAEVEKARAETLAANKRADGLFDEMVAALKAAQEEKNALQRAQTEELNRAVPEAVGKAVEILSQKLRRAEDELEKTRAENRDEVLQLGESYTKEKERMLEEMARRENYVETADLKIQELERDILKYRQNASGELLKQIAEQDERFRGIVAEEKIRREARERAFAAELERARTASDARVKQLEDLLAAKETLMAEGDKFYRQKQLELDGMHSAFNQGVNKANEELFAQKQALSEKEKALNDYRLKLEKESAARNAEAENMKAELTRAILEYKRRK